LYEVLVHKIWCPTWGTENKFRIQTEKRRKMPEKEESTETRDEVFDNLRRLRAIRGGYRGQITRFDKDSKALMRDYEKQNDCSKDETLLKLKSSAKTLQEKHGLLAKLDEEIMKKCPINDITIEVEESTDVATRIHEIVAKIDAFEKTVRTNLRNEKSHHTK